LANTAAHAIRSFGGGIIAVNYQDIDPVDVSTGRTWQDHIGAPTEMNTDLVIIFLGERVGRPLDALFGRRKEFSERLKKHKFNWIHVAGEDPEPRDPGQVPL